MIGRRGSRKQESNGLIRLFVGTLLALVLLAGSGVTAERLATPAPSAETATPDDSPRNVRSRPDPSRVVIGGVEYIGEIGRVTRPDDHTMTWPSLVLLAAYCVLIVLASLAGGWLPFWIDLTHTRMQLTVSLVAGLMLGVALFHLLPHSYGELADHGSAAPLDRAVAWLMFGLLTMFFLIRAFHFHHHGVAEVPDHAHAPPHDCGHEHRHDPPAVSTLQQSHRLSWTGATFGLALHTLIDGMALAASVQAEAAHGGGFWLWGLGTFLAIVLHKPLDAVSISSLMAAGGWSRNWRQLVNVGFALMCPLGAAAFLVGVSQSARGSHLIVGCGLAFAAGVFLCISLGDLLPELEFHAHDRIKLSAALLLGIALAWGIGFLEPAHSHQHSHIEGRF